MEEKYYYDFHLHSCLSPCGDDDMTPYNLVNMAALMGLQVIALTDHNSCKNCKGAVNAGKAAGITVVPGMELCTSEEIHLICLFETVEDADSFSDYIHAAMPPIQNKKDIFGNQLVMNETDSVLEEENILLTLASSVCICEAEALVERYNGVCFPAHIDRASYSVLSVLGEIPEDTHFRLAEYTPNANIERFEAEHPILKKMGILQSSDAHYLTDISEPIRRISLKENSPHGVIEALRGFERK